MYIDTAMLHPSNKSSLSSLTTTIIAPHLNLNLTTPLQSTKPGKDLNYQNLQTRIRNNPERNDKKCIGHP
jgi:hypothetical protein